MKDIFKKEIIAIVPKYVDSKGNCTIVHRTDSTPLTLDKTIKTVIKLIGKNYMIDLNEMKKKYRPLLPSHNLMPIPLSKNDVFIPFKTRIPMYKNDGAFSYINMKYIKEIKKKDKSTIVILDNDVKIQCLSSLDTVNKHMRNGKIISRCYEDRSLCVADSEEMYHRLIPATKADIQMLTKKLEELAKNR